MNDPKRSRNLLIIDDDHLLCDMAEKILSDHSLSVFQAHRADDGMEICLKKRVDIVLLDQKLPDADGVNLCDIILSHNEQCKIIFITAYPSFNNAVNAIKAGAFDYLSKPFEMEELRISVQKVLRTLDLERVEHLHQYNRHIENRDQALIGNGKKMGEVKRLIELAAENDAPVLITGETGSGKGVVAKRIHSLSAEELSPFIHMNCAAFPENLIEAELFGHEKGAFTGAVSGKKGIFELAEGGTLFLDELGELPIHLQSKLLGVLDDKKVRRIGGETARHINTRVIAATNINLDQAIKKGKFRKDLYYRLNVITIQLPCLRERAEDIPALCDYFVNEMVMEPAISISPQELDRLQRYDWPGNVRELKNIIERAIIIRKGAEINPSMLTGNTLAKKTTYLPATSNDPPIIPLRELERRHIIKALEQLSHNHTRTAEQLGISRSTLMRKIKYLQMN